MEQVKYLDQLVADCETAKKAVCIKDFILTKDSDLDDILSAIYIIKEINGDSQKTFDEFSSFRKEQEEKKDEEKLKCAQLNSPSEVLYVGSSTTDLRKRLHQHTTNSPKGTYALRLKEWFSGEYEIQIKVYKETNNVLQLIEDNLSFNLKPAFGKRGSNNK